MSQLVVQPIDAFLPKKSFIPFDINGISGFLICDPPTLSQSLADQPCKSTNRGSPPCVCSENILQPPLPCSKLTHPGEECRSMGYNMFFRASWQNDNLASQLLGFYVMHYEYVLPTSKLSLFNWIFWGEATINKRIIAQQDSPFFTQKFIRSQKKKQPGLMVPQKATWWASFASCEKTAWSIFSEILQQNYSTTVEIWGIRSGKPSSQCLYTHKLINQQEWSLDSGNLGTSNRFHWWLDVTW